jgi:hypothetical protein
VNAWWPTSPKPGNLGDILTPWMMRRDGVEPRFVGTDYCGKVLGIGSTLRFAQKGDLVWTTGIMRRSDGPYAAADFRALRGPMSAEKCGVLGKVPVGDGALCLPRYYAGNGHKEARRDTKNGTEFLTTDCTDCTDAEGSNLSGLERVRLAVVPHYIDLAHRDEWPAEWRAEGVRVISPLTVDVEGFVDAILSAERVESSSLHGCIVAAAYGVPWRWVRIGNRLSGDDSKFEDFRLSLGQVNVDDLMAARPWMAEVLSQSAQRPGERALSGETQIART